MGLFSRLFGFSKPAPEPAPLPLALPAPEPLALPEPAQQKRVDVVPWDGNWYSNAWNGDKFEGGFGLTQDRAIDYWTLRARSARVYDENMFAAGLVQRLVNNIIANGLDPEVEPVGAILGMTDDEASAWAENVERQWKLWANTPWLCDARESRTFAQIQQELKSESYIEGDTLIVLKWNKQYNLPCVDTVRGGAVQSPMLQTPSGDNTLTEGVERDPRGRHVAYWIYKGDGEYDRLPVWGEKSKRRLALMYYNPGKRSDDVRGMPIMARSLQALKEIDTYSSALQRKAVMNSMVTMTIERDVNATTNAGKGVAFNSAVNAPREVEADSSGGGKAIARAQHMFPGMIVDRLAAGEKLRAHVGTASMEPLAQFTDSHLKPISWSNGLAPEVLFMEFNKSFSAAQAANNEMRLEVAIARAHHGAAMAAIYEEWFVASVLNGKIDAPGFVEAMNDPKKYDVYTAYLGHRWAGYVKPVVDLAKVVPAYTEMLEKGLTTHDRVCQELHGMDWDEVIRRLGKENAKLAEALKPLVELGLIGKGVAAPAKAEQAPQQP